jgi:hypothetical protein
MAWTQMTDMALTDEERDEMSMPLPMPEKPRYPFGLRICLTDSELEKLKLEPDCEIGDVIDLRAFATVTSVSKNDGPDGPCCRIELQIEKLSVEPESDDE